MPPSVLHGTIDLAMSASTSNKPPSFDNDQYLQIYIEDISQVPRRPSGEEHLKSNGSILLGETKIQLAREHEFPFKFQCEYDPTKASNGQFDKLCEQGLIVIAAEVDADGRDMTMLWLKSGPKKFEQNIKLTITDSYE